MTALAIFDFESNVIRTATGGDGEPLVCAFDLAKACGLVNPPASYGRIIDDFKCIISNDTPGGEKDLVFFKESGVYQFLGGLRPRKDSPMRSRVERLQKWIYGEVLPSIRKTGSYSLDETAEQEDDDELTTILRGHLRHRLQLKKLQREQERQLATITKVESVALEADRKADEAMIAAKATMDTITNRCGWVSVLGYARMRGKSLSRQRLAVLGAAATRRCRAAGIEPEKVNDTRWGMVNIYPETVLDGMQNEF